MKYLFRKIRKISKWKRIRWSGISDPAGGSQPYPDGIPCGPVEKLFRAARATCTPFSGSPERKRE